MSAGAFSDPGVIEASKQFTCIFVDCDWGRKNEDLSGRYGVQGYPTVVISGSDGGNPAVMGARNSAGVIAALNAAAGRPAAAPPTAEAPVFPVHTGQSLADAKRAAKPLAVYVYDESPASRSVHLAFADAEVQPLLERLHFTRMEFRRGSADCAKLGVDRAPSIVVLDPALEQPEAKPLARIQGSRTARELRRELDIALGGRGAAPEAAAPAKKAPAFELPRAEDYSDDEVDRQFIKASVAVAREWIRKGGQAKGEAILENIVKTYPKHVATAEAVKLLAELRR